MSVWCEKTRVRRITDAIEPTEPGFLRTKWRDPILIQDGATHRTKASPAVLALKPLQAETVAELNTFLFVILDQAFKGQL